MVMSVASVCSVLRVVRCSLWLVGTVLDGDVCCQCMLCVESS